MSIFNLNYPPIEQEPIYPSLTLLKQFDGNISPRGMAFNNGALYVVAFANNIAPPSYVYKITFNSNNVAPTLTSIVTNISAIQGNLLKPYNIIFDSSNNFYVSCQGNSNGNSYPVILKYNSSGTPVNFTSLNRNWFSVTKGNGLTIDSSNNLFVTDTSTSISVYNSVTGNLKVGNLITGLNNPTGIRFDSSSNLFVCNYSGNTVNKYSIKYTPVPSVDVSSIGYITALNGPNDINFDKYGYIYVANQNSNYVSYFSSIGTYLDSFYNTFSQPNNIAFDQNNNLYVSNFNGGINGFINKLSYFIADINGPLHINEAIGSIGSSKIGSLVLRHQNIPGYSSIIFQGQNVALHDYGYIRYRDSANDLNENARLEIGTEDNNGPSSDITSDALILQKSGGYVGIGNYFPIYTLDVSGTIRCTSCTTYSDYRLKTNIESLDESFTIDNLKPVKYIYSDKKKPTLGFIAHELQEIFPHLVDGEKDGKEFQTIYMMELIPILVKEIQQLKKEIQFLKQYI